MKLIGALCAVSAVVVAKGVAAEEAEPQCCGPMKIIHAEVRVPENATMRSAVEDIVQQAIDDSWVRRLEDAPAEVETDETCVAEREKVQKFKGNAYWEVQDNGLVETEFSRAVYDFGYDQSPYWGIEGGSDKVETAQRVLALTVKSPADFAGSWLDTDKADPKAVCAKDQQWKSEDVVLALKAAKVQLVILPAADQEESWNNFFTGKLEPEFVPINCDTQGCHAVVKAPATTMETVMTSVHNALKKMDAKVFGNCTPCDEPKPTTTTTTTTTTEAPETTTSGGRGVATLAIVLPAAIAVPLAGWMAN